MKSQYLITGALLFFLGFLLSGILIYGSSLRYTDLIEPTIFDTSSLDFYEKYQNEPGKYVFIDVRSASSYADIHAEGAINIPVHLMYDQRHNLPKKDQEIVLICSGGRASGVAYSYLEHFGFTNMTRIEGGIEAWVDAGLPTNSLVDSN